MKRCYTLKSGEKLNCWHNDLGWLTVMEDNRKDKEVLEFDRRSNDPTVDYHGEIIHVDDFDYMPLNEAIKFVNKAKETGDRWLVKESDLLATIMKEADKVGFIMEVEAFDTIIPGLGIGLKGSRDNMIECLMVPFEGNWKKDDWHYKIELRPELDEVFSITGRETYYFSDFCSLMLGTDKIEMVDREEYRKSHGNNELDSKVSVSVLKI